MPSNMSYAQALTEARALIMQQSNRIRADGDKLREQSEQIGSLQESLAAASAEVQRLGTVEAQLTVVSTAKEQAESLVGRQRLQIDQLESALREMQRVLGQQADRISKLTDELDGLRDQVPDEDDESALAAMNALLSAARKPGAPKQERVRLYEAA